MSFLVLCNRRDDSDSGRECGAEHGCFGGFRPLTLVCNRFGCTFCSLVKAKRSLAVCAGSFQSKICLSSFKIYL